MTTLADLLADPVDDDPLVIAARRVADDVLAPAAADVDRGAVPRSHLTAIGAAGLLDIDGRAPVGRRVTELLAGADLTTWFVQVQHHGPTRALAAAAPRFDALVADLRAGRQIAGIAFSHLRPWPRRPLTVTPLGGGSWRLDGIAPWYTGWGLNDVALVSAASADGDVVHVVIPACPARGLEASAPMDVAALRGALTVTLAFDDVVVGPDDVVAVQPVADWLARDAVRTADVVPAVFGVAASALTLLDAEGERRAEPAARDAAMRLAERWRELRTAAYGLMDGAEPEERVHERLALRAQAHRLLVESTTALVVAGAGPAMAASSPAQRKAREGLFLLVQAQTVASRTANLEAVGRDRRPRRVRGP